MEIENGARLQVRGVGLVAVSTNITSYDRMTISDPVRNAALLVEYVPSMLDQLSEDEFTRLLDMLWLYAETVELPRQRFLERWVRLYPCDEPGAIAFETIRRIGEPVVLFLNEEE